jgi:2-polyprenyl-6-methoxyphenol hydroxylase-like FAD-dependent oxidoreductase
MDDVLVVGGRCAGASTALRLARAGLRVRLVERARHLGDVVSGHLVKPLGVRLLHDWGVLDALEEAGTPPLGDRVLWLDGRPQPAPPPPPGVRPPIAPRRTVLDPLLLDAARSAGAIVELGVSVDGVLRDGPRVVGVSTSAGERRARLVVGADGRRSRLAALVGAPFTRYEMPVTFAYYTYWRGSRIGGVHAWLERGLFVGMFPTNDELALAFIQAPAAGFQAARRAPLDTYVAALRAREPLRDLLGNGVIAERLRGISDLPSFFRVSAGPGWVLAGDAGHHKDPVIARGIADAFRDAELIAEAAVAGWDGGLDDALSAYPARRDQDAAPLAAANLDVARLERGTEELGHAWMRMTVLEREIDSRPLRTQPATVAVPPPRTPTPVLEPPVPQE